MLILFAIAFAPPGLLQPNDRKKSCPKSTEIKFGGLTGTNFGIVEKTSSSALRHVRVYIKMHQ